MTPRQLHLLQPGDKVRGKDGVATVTAVVVYLDKTVKAVKIGNTMYQREEMLMCFKLTRQGARRRG